MSLMYKNIFKALEVMLLLTYSAIWITVSMRSLYKNPQLTSTSAKGEKENGPKKSLNWT